VVANHTIYVTFVKGNGVTSPALSNLQVYPNPTTGELRIENEELRMWRFLMFMEENLRLTTYGLQLKLTFHIFRQASISCV
jgi:hypothetical protein